MFRVIAATFDVGFAARAVEALTGHASVVRGDPRLATLREAVQRMRPDLVLVDTDSEFGVASGLAELIGGLREADADHLVVAFGDAGAAPAVLAAIRAGARDFLSRDLGAEAMRQPLLDSLGRVLHRAKSDTAMLFGVISGQANDGESLMAINYAVMRAAQGNDVLLIDCNLPATEASAALDVEFRYTLRDAIQDLSRLDRTLLASTLGRHPASGLHVLPLALAGEDVNDLAPSAVLSLLQVMRGLFGETIINFGGIRHPGLLAELIPSTTGLFFVTTQKFTSLKACKELLQALAPPPYTLDRITLVVDDYHDAISLTDKQIGTAMGLERVARLPTARVALVNALNRGKPLVLAEPRHPYAKALAKLAPARPAGRTGALREKRRGSSFLGRLVPG